MTESMADGKQGEFMGLNTMAIVADSVLSDE